ncbi:lipopolysaccharide heptosyltransferase I [Chitinimonas sp. BJB300]|uniref:lipopolysaccharide heptosyltransferase I n=1 Tax=Chitinimonas sp. BJB300 TaxID=1559339 RepID=UPI000C0D6550|nr:lipopolysaccharide heptosyltransferase I [Chitinimonas sp. BJB300]PHV12332.1 lipopolysaccharide heptosyltransferase I [Chitinimonas sp. BJB300]TSJ90953.1 lipopolysaccharide heptosyltransferase I [Chitinimonas sp. BJB300]
MPKILLIRLSSMGDVIHNFPAVTELRGHFPNAKIHWVVEEAFVGLAGLHPGVDQIVPFALRRWRKKLLNAGNRAEMRAFRTTIEKGRYDLAIDTQGLLKSALVGKLSGAALVGYSRRSVREPLACLFYDRRFDIPAVHVIERNRLITGRALGYTPSGQLNYGIQPPAITLDWQPKQPYVVCLTATSSDAKLWDETNWITLCQWLLLAHGLQPVFPWGNEVEHARAMRLAAALPGSLVTPRFSLVEGARLLADAQIAIGVDTGLMHLAAAVDIPTVGIFCDSDPHNTGAIARTFSQNLGGIQQPPSEAAVREVVMAALAAKR